jgi:hypothetical protein
MGNDSTALRRISPVSAGQRFSRVLRGGGHATHDKEGWLLGQHPGTSVPFATITKSSKRRVVITLSTFFALGFLVPSWAVMFQMSKEK